MSPRSPATSELLAPAALTTIYFATLFISLAHALRDISWSRRSGTAFTGRHPWGSIVRNTALVLFALAAASAAWYHIYRFMEDDLAAYPTASLWVAESSWFVKAYERVTATSPQWFWSSQLLQGVGSIVVFTYVESARGEIRGLSSFWLGCAAAISLAFPLFVAASWNTPLDTVRRRLAVPPSALLLVGVFASAFAVVLLPRVDSSAYGPVLGTVHGALLAPLAIQQLILGTSANVPAVTAPSGWIAGAYAGLAGVGATAQLFNSLDVIERAGSVDGFLRHVRAAYCANHCQCSISGDVLLTSVAVALYVIGARCSVPWSHRLALVAVTPVLSFATTFPLFLALREAALVRDVASYSTKSKPQ